MNKNNFLVTAAALVLALLIQSQPAEIHLVAFSKPSCHITVDNAWRPAVGEVKQI